MKKAAPGAGNFKDKHGVADDAGINGGRDRAEASHPSTASSRSQMRAAAAPKQVPEASSPAPLAPPPPPPAPPAPPAVNEVSMQAITPAASAPLVSGASPAVAASSGAATRGTSAAQARELDAIRLLFARHQDVEAEARLLRFRREYPRFVLPPDLNAHARRP